MQLVLFKIKYMLYIQSDVIDEGLQTYYINILNYSCFWFYIIREITKICSSLSPKLQTWKPYDRWINTSVLVMNFWHLHRMLCPRMTLLKNDRTIKEYICSAHVWHLAHATRQPKGYVYSTRLQIVSCNMPLCCLVILSLAQGGGI